MMITCGRNTILRTRTEFQAFFTGELAGDHPCGDPDRLFRGVALFHELVCQSLDLLVLECYLSLIRDEQDPVIRYGFFAIGCPDVHVVWRETDVRTGDTGPVIGSAPVNIPDLDVFYVVAVIVPVLLQEFMAG